MRRHAEFGAHVGQVRRTKWASQFDACPKKPTTKLFGSAIARWIHVRQRSLVKKGAIVIPFGDPPRLARGAFGPTVHALADATDMPNGARELVWARLVRAIQRNQKRERRLKVRLT